MKEISLYRKYRPQNFDNLVGQDNIRTTLINAVKNGNVSHAYLFTGPRGTGKTSTARLIAKTLVCANLIDNYEPCNECEFCKDINDERLIDIIEIDAASNRGIDEVRDLKEKINFAPTRAKYKVYIIDEVHMMTKEAFNALLKTLEEPPFHVYFILATTEVHKIPATIISRCQRFDFKRIDKKALMTRLSFIAQKEGIEAEDRALEAISKYVDGGLRDAIGLLEQLTTDGKLTYAQVQEILGVSDFNLLDNLYAALSNNNTKEALNIIHELHSQGSDLRQFVHEFVDILRNKMLKKISDDDNKEAAKLIRMIEVFLESQTKLESSIPQLALEIAIIQITGAAPENIEKEDQSNKIENKIKPEEMKRIHKPIIKPETIQIDLTFESIKENWARIIERVKTPALRMSIKDAVPLELSGVNLTLEFSTVFHKDKVMEHDHRIELEAIILELTGQRVKIITALKEIEIRPVVEEKRDIVDEALKIFGGEIVEDKESFKL